MPGVVVNSQNIFLVLPGKDLRQVECYCGLSDPAFLVCHRYRYHFWFMCFSCKSAFAQCCGFTQLCTILVCIVIYNIFGLLLRAISPESYSVST